MFSICLHRFKQNRVFSNHLKNNVQNAIFLMSTAALVGAIGCCIYWYAKKGKSDYPTSSTIPHKGNASSCFLFLCFW